MEKDRILTQNHGVLGEAHGEETEILNAETVPPDRFGHTEGGVPRGTPPFGPQAGAAAREGTAVENSEERDDQA